MNVHHLELFYFVAKHGGIAAAVRNIPYGIQQPAVSGQIAKLEESLGTKLFQRRPFALSSGGAELFDFIRPFFDNIDIVAEKMRQNSLPQLRIAAPSIVLHDYVPELLQKLRAKFPTFRLYLHEAARTEAERLLLAQDVDLAITLIEKKSRGGIQAVAASPPSAASSLSARRRRRGLVRQAFEHRPTIAGGTRDRSASANAPNEKRKAPLK